jgi:acetyl esterase/lipase
MQAARVAFAAAVAAIAASAPAQDAPEAKVVKQADVRYRTDPAADPDRHTLDFYAPAGKTDFPVLFFVHGGTWKTGHRSMYVALGQEFAKLGFGVVIPNYRLSPAVKHPAHVEDVAKAFAWAKANVGKHGGDPKRITLFGHSAGGHLVSLLALDPTYLKAEGLSPADVRGVVSVSGVYVIAPEVPVFQPCFGTDAKVCRQASPLTHVSGKHPPFLLAYGDKDFPGLDIMAVDMAAALKKCGAEHTLLKCADRTHYTIILESIQPADPLHRAIRDFARR